MLGNDLNESNDPKSNDPKSNDPKSTELKTNLKGVIDPQASPLPPYFTKLHDLAMAERALKTHRGVPIKPEWRFGLGWTNRELTARIRKLHSYSTNFPEAGPESQEVGTDWNRYYTEAEVGWEEPGKPELNGAFATACRAVSEYQFSDPSIVTAHFDPTEPLENRNMLLEIKVLGLRYLCGTRVTDVEKSETKEATSFGFRYDTLQDHMEVGSEWFTVTKRHATGAVFFRISASWRPGLFPNWWSRTGFEILGRRYQLAWHRLAYIRLREIVGSNGRTLVPVPHGEHLVHTGPELSNSRLWASKIPLEEEKLVAQPTPEASTKTTH